METDKIWLHMKVHLVVHESSGLELSATAQKLPWPWVLTGLEQEGAQCSSCPQVM